MQRTAISRSTLGRKVTRVIGRGAGLGAGVLLLGSLLGCPPGGTVGGPNPLQNPIITRFEVFQNPQTPGAGPFEMLAQASGEGVLTFTWSATGGLLSVASQSVPASGSVLIPSFSAWQPPANLGVYEVSVTVQDSGGGSYRRIARFQVDRDYTRILDPFPTQVSPPGVWIF